jgi:hypothetical protein
MTIPANPVGRTGPLRPSLIRAASIAKLERIITGADSGNVGAARAEYLARGRAGAPVNRGIFNDLANIAKRVFRELTDTDSPLPNGPIHPIVGNGGPCILPWRRAPDGSCQIFAGERPGPNGDGGAVGGGIAPTLTCVETHVCPTFADGKKGILWINPLTNTVICLPRGCSGKGFGLIRKNRPRAKAYISAASIRELKGMARTQKKAKAFARLAGLTTKRK